MSAACAKLVPRVYLMTLDRCKIGNFGNFFRIAQPSSPFFRQDKHTFRLH